MSNSAPSATVTVNGCSPSPATFSSDGTVHNITMNPSCTYSLSFTNSGSTRDGFSVSGAFAATSANQNSCASGTCSELDLTAYLQDQFTCQVSAQAQSTFDGSLTFTVSGTSLGAAGSTLCSLQPASTDTVKSATVWADYNAAVNFPSNPTGQATGTQWAVSGTSSFTPVAGGNIYNVNYYKQVLVNNPKSYSMVPKQLGATATATTASTFYNDYNGAMSITQGVSSITATYSCVFHPQNQSYIYQYSPSGLQLLTSGSVSNLNDYSTSNPAYLQFADTVSVHAILCIPAAAQMQPVDRVMGNGVQITFSKSSTLPGVFFNSQVGVNEVDFLASQTQQTTVGGTSSTSTSSSSTTIVTSTVPSSTTITSTSITWTTTSTYTQGQLVRLPDGQLATIQSVNPDGTVTVKLPDGSLEIINTSSLLVPYSGGPSGTTSSGNPTFDAFVKSLTNTINFIFPPAPTQSSTQPSSSSGQVVTQTQVIITTNQAGQVVTLTITTTITVTETNPPPIGSQANAILGIEIIGALLIFTGAYYYLQDRYDVVKAFDKWLGRQPKQPKEPRKGAIWDD